MRATLAFNQPLSPAYRHVGLAAPGFPGTFRAGQFVMVRPHAETAPFLPRAFSIYRLGPGRHAPVVEILYKVLGTGTQCLAGLQPGDEVELLGPLGNHFSPAGGEAAAVLVAGGIGVPPIAALASECGMRNAECGMEERFRMHVFLGGRTREDILCVKDFEEAGATIEIATEDGSLGTRGMITDLLEPFLTGTQALGHSGTQESPKCRTARLPECRLYACGPPGMLRAVAGLAERYGVPCQTSVEATMACGFGACMGCAIEVRGDASGPSYKLVCKDGPVFDSREIVWSES